jgi:hypothetical protein
MTGTGPQGNGGGPVRAPTAGAGPLLFARFAYPPNALGYCGPDACDLLLDYAGTGTSDPGLRRLARGFSGAWPYLELIAHANGLADPLDEQVVEAYWLGNELLDGVDVTALGASIEERFRPVAGRAWPELDAIVQRSPRPHHNFHVFCIYPWVGLLRTGATDQALHVLDRCRVRWGRVRSVGPSATAEIDSFPLTWDGHRLGLGPSRTETVTFAQGGRSLAPTPAPGDLVACHWDWLCHRLTPRQARHLRAETDTQLHLVNHQLVIPPPAAALS